MRQLEDLVRYEPANSSLAFRERGYDPDERATLLRDVVALANAAVPGPRFMVVGVLDAAGGKRQVRGIERAAWTAFKDLLNRTLATAVDPPLKATTRSLEVDGKLIGLLCLPACDDPPYLLSGGVESPLSPGCGWIRRGTDWLPLVRADLQRMFDAKAQHAGDAFDVVIGFRGDPPQNEITLAALPLDALPSAIAAQKLRTMLEAQQNAKAILGKTQTHLARLVHAKLFGIDRPYERHSDDSLRVRIDRAAEECRAADEHYQFELRAHRLEVVVLNRGAKALSNAALSVTLPRLDGFGVAERLYTPDGVAAGTAAYPRVTTHARTIDIETTIDTVPAGATAAAFREAPRFWARPTAVGKALAVDCTLHARELRAPLRETLVARIVAPRW